MHDRKMGERDERAIELGVATKGGLSRLEIARIDRMKLCVVCPKPCSTRVLTHYLNAISINYFGNQDL
jgi:hypothetical protein